MEQTIETRASPKKVWESWERAHAVHEQKNLKPGVRGKAKADGGGRFQYQILDVVPGESFSILWKTFFVRLIFTHKVEPSRRGGAEIRYGFQIQGLFAWPVRLLLRKKIQSNLSLVLKAMVKQLES